MPISRASRGEALRRNSREEFIFLVNELLLSFSDSARLLPRLVVNSASRVVIAACPWISRPSGA
jgi:hypothetical protein